MTRTNDVAELSLDPALARRIRFVGLDVDGVLTDGGIYLGDADGARLEFKRYDIQDGLGIHFLRDAGIRVGIVTGRVSESVRLRARELEVDDLAQDSQAQKFPALVRMLERHGLSSPRRRSSATTSRTSPCCAPSAAPSPSATPRPRWRASARCASPATAAAAPCGSSPISS